MLIKVAVGLILRDEQVFIALRHASQHQGGLWEFPGGKCEASEAADVALARELQEECGIQVEACEHFDTIAHDYGDKQVELIFFKVTDFTGEPSGSEGQEIRWVSITELADYDFPEANVPIVKALMSDC
ncbi:8-oxo-dGTP diphosphatase MutT [Marinomonas posidonica]|uniref:8-oxo-dGTP diphosphatase n=1 Tax=Marinomonas posidonica (strain CECT 7376 / NCIMB 14433 / IVIA-Po-181) TaxID=491952 RepID=F6CXU6_MARPP|nr:8-oxo-dGTP diphosphatase MutT [Marinomonas posidonica]AEF54508.1 mutator MutT protein [Marinomonas posidonica IVIA-Po-181]